MGCTYTSCSECVSAIRSFTRDAPLRVRLEHRELASHFSAYEAPREGLLRETPRGPWGAPGAPGVPGGDVYHLVFSYDPSAVSARGKGSFRYLEGQSVSFVSIIDNRQQQQQKQQQPVKPRLYSIASSPAAPELGLKHFFSLVGDMG